LAVELVPGLPLFAPGMDVASEIAAAALRAGLTIGAPDVVVVAQKIVSKAEGRTVDLAHVVPGPEAERLATATGRPAAMVQLILDESDGLLRATPAAVIARHRSGHVLANAGIDASNVAQDNAVGGAGAGAGEAGMVLLWPEDADASARRIRAALAGRPAVVIADSMGRAWRIGTVGQAIGVAGLAVFDDRRGKGSDLFGRTLQATVIAVADALAGMAVLAMGEGDEGTPAAVVRGASRWITAEDGPGAGAGLRPAAEDMFR
jgi:coenzyme F420-0:L-glutamate ligase/coenzyme F420-1:gamma-L-glutamate ligase